MGDNLVLFFIGQAEDVALLSNDLHKLRHILSLVVPYCEQFNIHLSTSKTKLLMISPPRNNYFVPYSPIFINGETIYLEQAKHVSVLRFTQGNGPYTLNNNFQECLVVYLGGVGQTQPPQSKYSHQKIMS